MRAALLVVLLAAGCGGRALRVSWEGPEPEKSAPAAETPSGGARPADAAHPPAGAAAPNAVPGGGSASAAPERPAPPPVSEEVAAAERAERAGLLYRNWRRSQEWLVRALDRGLWAPSNVRDEINYVRLELLKLRSSLDAEGQAAIDACAAEYADLAARYAPGQGRATARLLETLGRKVDRAVTAP
jgi:hypothetical protein